MNRPDPVMHHLIAAMLYAWSLVGVSYTWDSKSVPRWVSTSVVCYLAAIALFQALQASWRAWRGHKVVMPLAPPSAKAPLWPTSTADQVFETYVAERAEQQHAEAIAAVAADTPLPERKATAAFTAVMPVAKVYSPWARKITNPSGLPWTAPARHGCEPAGVAR